VFLLGFVGGDKEAIAEKAKAHYGYGHGCIVGYPHPGINRSAGFNRRLLPIIALQKK